jgi:HEAT repeat protein
MQCFATLVKVTGDPSTGLPMLISLLTEESDPALRAAYIEKIGMLGMLGNDAQDASETILKYFTDPSPAVRAAAAIAQARTSRDFSSSEPEWLRLLSDPDPDVLANAVMAIASYGTDASAAIPVLEKISEQEPSALAIAAIKKITEKPA